ncbi:Alpha/beta hydrolase fold-1 [Microdochium trichocladiopsis]|uniref:Alpha/beta hydrolase fold-1 n=1 Tax=Microdochium trichocladiopsis TaxID=1682393 RepID=A0A9P8XSW8_9PEZI|nr:Alpha/beta hydrolase fold-1 [Microdochium trichocladiopsis]KAH7010633.1 Alpha/beta hydrolase fold-1 [Microdochium trichocladiopsis]
MPKPVIVIVPGAWLKPVCHDAFVHELNTLGFGAFCVSLPTVGSARDPPPDLHDDIAAVQQALRSLANEGRKALVVAHSSGGLISSNAVAGQDNVVGLIYLAAFLVRKGESLMDLLGGQPLPWMDVQGEKVFGKPSLVASMTHTALSLFTQASNYEPWATGLTPCAYIYCEDDNALPIGHQKHMASLLGSNLHTTTLKAGHCPFLSMPAVLAEAVKALEEKLDRCARSSSVI